jgi:hypothetical protein
MVQYRGLLGAVDGLGVLASSDRGDVRGDACVDNYVFFPGITGDWQAAEDEEAAACGEGLRFLPEKGGERGEWEGGTVDVAE